MAVLVNDQWYEDFFQGLNCELWEKAVSADWTHQEVDFLISELNIEQGQHILDIPCGFGRHAIALAKRGFQVTGVDISETFISSLNKKIRLEQLTIETMLADILTVSLPKTYSAAICMGNSFGYFNYDKMKVFVEKVSASLEVGGRFIINSGMIAESILPNFSSHKSFTIGDITMDIHNLYCVEDSYMISNINYTKGTLKEAHAFKHYVFTLGEVKRLLKASRLNTIGAYSSIAKKEYELGDQQIYLVCEKA